jgi:hypothetical protein
MKKWQMISSVVVALVTVLSLTVSAFAPFTNIVQSETTHIAALERLFNAYGLPIPPDTYAGHVQAPATPQDAAQTGVRPRMRMWRCTMAF